MLDDQYLLRFNLDRLLANTILKTLDNSLMFALFIQVLLALLL